MRVRTPDCTRVRDGKHPLEMHSSPALPLADLPGGSPATVGQEVADHVILPCLSLSSSQLHTPLTHPSIPLPPLSNLSDLVCDNIRSAMGIFFSLNFRKKNPWYLLFLCSLKRQSRQSNYTCPGSVTCLVTWSVVLLSVTFFSTNIRLYIVYILSTRCYGRVTAGSKFIFCSLINHSPCPCCPPPGNECPWVGLL